MKKTETSFGYAGKHVQRILLKFPERFCFPSSDDHTDGRTMAHLYPSDFDQRGVKIMR